MDTLQISLLVGGCLILALVGLVLWAFSRAKQRAILQAIEWLRSGVSKQGVRLQLASQEYNAEQTEAMLRTAWKRMVVEDASKMIADGASEDQIRQRLAACDVPADKIDTIINDLTNKPWIRRHPILGTILGVVFGLPITVAGIVLLFASLVLRDGNVTGRFVTFPFAGALTKVLGMFVSILGLAVISLPYLFSRYTVFELDEEANSAS